MKRLTMTLIAFAMMLLICNQLLGQTQAQMNQDACGEYKRADAEMNRAYRKVINDYKRDSPFTEKLKRAQRAWIAFRDAHLASLYPEPDNLAYGSANPMCRCTVLAELTSQRTQSLTQWINGIEEGDVCSGSVKTKK